MCPPTRYECLQPSQIDLDQSSHGGSKHLGRLWGKGQHLVGGTWLGGCLQLRLATHLGWSHAAAWHLSLLGPVGHVCTQHQKMHDEATNMALWLGSHQHWTLSLWSDSTNLTAGWEPLLTTSWSVAGVNQPKTWSTSSAPLCATSRHSVNAVACTAMVRRPTQCCAH